MAARRPVRPYGDHKALMWGTGSFGSTIDFVRFRRETDDELDRLEVTA